eukprot:NODE_9859_length_622_cov_73.893788_g9591_i0.p1 GENE.NODE_9859_length_622_cov_73.893788_g9591_i0~~NODE_9859_length_622_cov_73.893788_g9591_i0.p1  ORF type:complete len:118 (-),score=33.14 NODE_9859_length_622_cov_73.893788_g9591_i0:207-560(-)
MSAKIIEALEEWLIGNDEFADKMENFAKDNCDIFELDSTEMKLEYTDVYKKFRALFEGELESFVKGQGVTVEEFFKIAQEENAKADGDSSIKLIASLSDYEVFHQMMQDEKKKKASA